MNWLKHLFGALFGAGNEDAAQKVLHGVSSLVSLGLPVVEELEDTVKAGATTTLTERISAFLQRRESDAGKVQTLLNLFQGLQTPDLLHELAVWAIGQLAPGAAGSALNLAAELAYSIFKTKNTKTA